MRTVHTLYYDGTIVQALTAQISGGSVTVRDARSFLAEELDDYLTHCREKTCVVCCNPQGFFQDIVYLPPAAGKLYNKLVRSEVQKAHPELVSFSIFFRTIGETTIDGKLYCKIAVFSYPDEFLADFIQAVSRHGVTVSSVYAAPGSIFRLGLSACAPDPGQPRIFIATLPGEKLFLVSESNELEFIRKIPSLDSALLPEDANNINMTVDYCFQSLRVRPFEAAMLNQPELPDELTSLVSVPCRTLLPLQLENVPPHIIQDYLAPVAAALQSVESPGIGNILPSDYANFATNKKLLTAAALLMFVLTLFLAGYLVTERMIISGLKSKISKMRTELSVSEGELVTFRKLDAEAQKLKQPLELINKQNSSLNPASALAALVVPESPEYVVRRVNVQSGEGGIPVQIDGTINASGFSDTQASYEKLVAQFSKLPGYAVLSSNVDIKQKTFSIQARYNGGGQQAR